MDLHGRIDVFHLQFPSAQYDGGTGKSYENLNAWLLTESDVKIGTNEIVGKTGIESVK